MGIATVPCLDTSLSKEQIYARLQQSGNDLRIVLLDFHPKLHPLHDIWSQLIWSGPGLLTLRQTDALWKFDISYRKQSRILQRALFFIWQVLIMCSNNNIIPSQKSHTVPPLCLE